MKRPQNNDELGDPRLAALATGEVPADVEARGRVALAQLRDKMDGGEPQRGSTWFKRWAVGRRARLAWAGSLAATLVAIFLFVQRPGVAFADVAARLRTARTMIYQAFYRIEGAPRDGQTIPDAIHMQFYFKQPNLMRCSLMDGSAWTVMNTSTKLGVSINKPQKTYVAVDSAAIPTSPFDPVEAIQKVRTLPDRADQDLGRRKIDGRILQGFLVHEAGSDMVVWVDPGNCEPVRIDITYPDVKGMSRTLTDFRFDVPLDDSLFDMTPPAGYGRVQIKLEMPTQADVIWFLKHWSEGDPNHEYPFSLLAQELTRSKTFDDVIARGFGDKRQIDQQRQMEIALRTGRVFQFQIMLQKSGGQWRYAGRGVKRGDPVPICWWKEKGAGAWHVIYGDLKTADVPLDGMERLIEKIQKISADTQATSAAR